MRNFSTCLFILLMSTLLYAQSAPIADKRGSDNQDLVKREQQYCDAFKNRDETVLQELLSPDFVFTDDTGQFSKAQYIQAVMEDYRVQSYELKDLVTRVYGDTGIVTGLWTGRFTLGGKDQSGSFRFTDTFLKRNGRWYAIASKDAKLQPVKGS